MMLKQLRNAFLLLLFVLPSVSLANDELRYNQINLQTAASSHIANDLLIAMLVVQETGSDSALLANKVNKKMTKVLSAASRFKDVDSHTVSYTTRPMYRKGVIYSWQVSQTIKLSSQNFEQLGHLIAKVNTLADVQSMQFTVSDLTLEQTQEKLTKQAIAKFRAKAAMVTEQFDKSDYVIVQVNIGSNYHSPRPMMERSLMAADSAAPPALAAGTNKITVNINGSIELL